MGKIRDIATAVGGMIGGLVLAIVGIGVWSAFAGIAGVVMGGGLITVGAAISLYSLFFRMPVSTAVLAPGSGNKSQLAADPLAMIAAARLEHAVELERIVTPARRGQALMLWRGRIDRDAHGYADWLVAQTPESREDLMRGEAALLMDVYFAGCLAGAGHLAPGTEQQFAYAMGRAWRDHLRQRGLSLEDRQLFAAVAQIDGILLEIARQGMQDGQASRAS